MKKSEQIAINERCIEHEFFANNQLNLVQNPNWKQIRKCQAWYTTTDDYYILKSYNTIVAAIFKPTKVCYNFMRHSFDFTTLADSNNPGFTTTQHVHKFMKEYEAVTLQKLNGYLSYKQV